MRRVPVRGCVKSGGVGCPRQVVDWEVVRRELLLLVENERMLVEEERVEVLEGEADGEISGRV